MIDKTFFVGRPETEKLDCAVRAWCIASGKPYKEVHKDFKEAGRKDGHRTARKTSVAIAEKYNFKKTFTRITVGRFLRENVTPDPKVLYINGHGFAVKFNNVIDYEYVSPRKIVKVVFEKKT